MSFFYQVGHWALLKLQGCGPSGPSNEVFGLYLPSKHSRFALHPLRFPLSCRLFAFPFRKARTNFGPGNHFGKASIFWSSTIWGFG